MHIIFKVLFIISNSFSLHEFSNSRGRTLGGIRQKVHAKQV
ncbi:hypothetical protein MtrunA17_Chr2g0305011 [Medicago truncatula]|uniref:Uncharacterized protein n=1 Tax=Medicago truncatula TaxID=3880 RepID=A0A396JFX6_MEDTR|nr:hypothetical protein MtrunA17_Chr2g0305011 [Medicago truncatula]